MRDKNRKLDPKTKEILYNIDEEDFYCLFEIKELLMVSFWN
ncbi:hypothetical protein [Tepidibacter aestuarii]|nr:hypothetical protein [Tepidibacter aestuarii]CAH2213705.1 protein of unknown function [Tepidibacter aestuarii]